jgi:phosphate transport system permease protein
MQTQVEKGRAPQRARHLDFLRTVLIIAAFAIPVIAALSLYALIQGSVDSIQALGLEFLTSTKWIPNPPNGGPPILGALPAMYGSVVTTLIALLFAVPVSLGIALFQSELAPRKLRLPSIFLVELLAAVPSVVYGLWGLLFLVPFMRDYVDPGLIGSFGFIPIFSGEPNGLGMLTAGVILAIMIVPYAAAVMREVVTAVPRSQREACIALGGTTWETMRMAVIPYAGTGIIAAIVLAMGRAIGETMAVTMVIGNVARITPSLFLPAETIPSVIANEFTEVAGNNIYLAALFELGLILFAIAFVMNLIGRLLIKRLAFQGAAKNV